ncbi:Hsp20/alpha crystallin family protein [Candidatus Parcubacteria bacterium]|nr:Hsp20/alpha crystallin family protein [Candidatus Parcubacteria bacterium]
MSFFEKLKKSIGIEEETEKETPEKNEVEIKEKKGKELPEKEGELVIDMYQKGDELVIEAPLGGVSAEDIEISLEDKVLIIEGERKREEDPEREYFIEECYWGKFSRRIILPFEVDMENIEAQLKNGILKITLLKSGKTKKKKITVK